MNNLLPAMFFTMIALSVVVAAVFVFIPTSKPMAQTLALLTVINILIGGALVRNVVYGTFLALVFEAGAVFFVALGTIIVAPNLLAP